jgi:N6-adenosine-specific RNA methylase IME4
VSSTIENGPLKLTPPPRRYRVIYADPPWNFATYSKKGKGRSADAHYDTMTLADIKRLPVADWALDDAVLLMWATDPLLDRALEVVQAWGFKYKTVGFYWVKQNPATASYFTGLGFWTRANPEQCLLATRGHPKRVSASVRKLVVSPRREHSRKPDEMHGYIEQLVEGPYLEMFARHSRPGWDCWGAQTGLFDQGSVQTRRWGSQDAASSPIAVRSAPRRGRGRQRKPAPSTLFDLPGEVD